MSILVPCHLIVTKLMMGRCALIHRHRPDLLDFDSLDKNDARANVEKAFGIAEQSLGIPVSALVYQESQAEMIIALVRGKGPMRS